MNEYTKDVGTHLLLYVPNEAEGQTDNEPELVAKTVAALAAADALAPIAHRKHSRNSKKTWFREAIAGVSKDPGTAVWLCQRAASLEMTPRDYLAHIIAKERAAG